MNQVITQHGWGLDHNVWIKLKNKFIQNDWLWQDNERGYYSALSNRVNWIKEDSDKTIKVVLCHSLGIHLIEKKILKEATHIVLINSFNNFIPNNNESKITIKSLKRMEKKINSKEIKLMLEKFITKSFKPNEIDQDFSSIFQSNLNEININLLLEDFQKLYSRYKTFSLFKKNTDVLMIKSKNDQILKEYACDEFVELLNKRQINKPKLVQLDKQGHIINNIDILKIIEDWIKSIKHG